MTLFKYTRLEYIPSCIENGIYASRLDQINDPYEGHCIRYLDQFRVACLTTSSYQMLMWAYYGNHKGCCIEFGVDGIDTIRKVDYIKEFQSHEDMTAEQIKESLYRKGHEWQHENEFRLVYHEPTADKKLWKRDGDKVFLLAPVKRVIFGYAAEMDERYPEMLAYLKQFNESHEEKIEVTKCRLMGNKYQLEGDKQFDLEAELQIYPPTGKQYRSGTFEVYDGKYTVSDSASKVKEIRQLYEEIREEAAKLLFRYGSTFTYIVEKPDARHEEASKVLFEFAEKISGFLTKKIDNIEGIPSRADLKEVCSYFVGLSHSMYAPNGTDPFHVLEGNARSEDEIKRILKI